MAKRCSNALVTVAANRLLGLIPLGTDRRGQDLIEYALMAGFFSLLAAGIFPSVYIPSMSTIWSKVGCVLSTLGGS